MKLATVILAAGKGTRMKSDLPKVLHPVLGKPMLEYVIEAAQQIGSDHIIVIVGHQAERIQKTIQSQSCFAKLPLHFVKQEPQLGTGHAVLQAQFLLEEVYQYGSSDRVLVLSGDVPLIRAETLKQMTQSDLYHPHSVATLLSAQAPDPTGFGRVIRNPMSKALQEIIEEKDITSDEVREIREINTGTYLFQAQLLFQTLPLLQNNNRQQEYYLPDVIKIWTAQQKIITVCPGDFEETQGVNTPQQLSQVEQVLRCQEN